MNDIAQIKTILTWLTADTFDAMYAITTPDLQGTVFQAFVAANTRLTQALSQSD